MPIDIIKITIILCKYVIKSEQTKNLKSRDRTYVYTYMCVVLGVTKSKGLKNTSVHSDSLMVPHGSQQSDITLEEEGDANEQLYQKWFEEGYDIYDEEYVKWLMANHPNDVPSEWLTDISTSSMVPATTTASQPDKSTKSDKIVLNPRKRSRAYDTKPGGPEDIGNYISKYLHQAMQEKDNKRKRLLEKEKRKEERERERAKRQKRWQPLRRILA